MNQKLFVKFPVKHCYVAGMYESLTLVSLSSFLTLTHRLSIAAEYVIYFAHFSETCLHLKQSGWQSNPEKYPAATLAQTLPAWESEHQNDLRAVFSLNVPFTLTVTVNGCEALCDWCLGGLRV